MTQQEAEVKLKVNSKEAIDKLNQLEKEAEQLRAKFSECFRKGDTRGINETTKELNKVNKQIQNLRTNAANIESAMKRIDEASPKELQRTIKMINSELNSGRVKRGTKEWEEYCDQLKRVKRELGEVNDEMSDQGSILSRLKDKFNDWGASAATAMAAFAGVVMSGKAAVQAYADMEAEEANVRKFTGMTAEEVKDLNEEFKKIDTRTSREDLNKLAQEAGRLGKQSKEDVLGFVRAANQINVALDDLGEGATLTLSKLTGIFGDEKRLGTERSLLAVGSVINVLSQNCSASSPYLAEFAQRLAGVGAQAKMTIPQVMGIAAVLDTQGQNLEASATAVSQLIIKMYQDPAKFAKAAGLEVKSFTELLKKDANEAVLTLLDSLNKMGGMEKLAPVFDEMGTDGARASAVLSALAGNIEDVRRQQVNANIAFKEATSVTKEYDVQNNTVQANLDKAKKRFTELAVSLGEKLLPVMRYAISGSSMMMRALSAIVDFIIKHKGTITSLAIGIAAYTIAVKANTIATTAWTAITKLGAIAGSTLRSVVNLSAAAFFALTGRTRQATVCMHAFNTAIKANPIGLLVGLIASGISALISWNEKVKEATQREKELREETENYRKELRNIDQQSAEYAKSEITRLKALYEEATNEAKSKETRLAAAKKLQEMYPDYFRNLKAEEIMVGKAKTQYDNLTQSIINSARARAAAAKIEENEKELLELESKLDQQKADRDKKQAEEDKKRRELEDADRKSKEKTNSAALGDNREMSSKDVQDAISKRNKAQSELKAAKEQTQAANDLVNETTSRINEIESANEELAKKYKISADELAQMTVTEEIVIPTVPIGETEKERKAREKAEREAAKAEREAAKAQREDLKESLDQQKALRDKAYAEALAQRAAGLIDYKEYTEKKHQIDLDYIAHSKKTYEDANLTETDEYAALLRKEEELKAKHSEALTKATLHDLEQEYKEQVDFLTEQYLSPSSVMWQNHKLYNEALLEEDLVYMHQKLELYAAGSEEWERINDQINERVANDKLAKQKEMAELIMQHSKEYLKKDRDERLQYESDLLQQMYEMKLITEEQYQEALKSLRDKYRREETEAEKEEIQERHQQIEEEYAGVKEIIANSNDAIAKPFVDLAISWEKCISDMANNGEGFWTSFGELAKNTISIVSGMMSQFSALANAERDLELAKIEKRYNAEIKAAGKNSKKVAQLEAQKEKEIADTKKKYNDQAMKMELAQAVAQAAVNAILGYQAGLKFPSPANTFMPALLAGLAIAQGAIQIAIIKKQHDAQAAGYYEGGFTGGANYKREAGVVHEGEFVVNHNAVNNPQLSPLLRMLDAAQRNNTVGSLTAEDVSNALGQGIGVSARGEVAAATPTIVTNSIDTSSLDTLNALLADGIEATVILDGERGLHRKYQHFLNLINNPKR